MLYCGNNSLKSLDLSKNTALEFLSCYSNKIRGAAMDSLIASLVDRSTMAVKGLMRGVNLDDANEVNLITTVQVAAALARGWNITDGDGHPYSGMPIITLTTSLPVNSQIKLVIIAKGNVIIDGATGTFVDSKEVTYTTTSKKITIIGEVFGLSCDNDSITSLDLSNCVLITNLWCRNNQLQSLDLSKNTLLRIFYCNGNKLKSLDLSKKTGLMTFVCNDNQIESLDLSNNTGLELMDCSNNKLQSLDLSDNKILTELNCRGNLLQLLDLSNNTELKKLNCSSNQLQSLDLSKNTALEFLSCYSNKIRGRAMDALIASLIDRSAMAVQGVMLGVNLDDANEVNMITVAQVAAASARGWYIFDYRGDPYQGRPVITMNTEKAIGSPLKLTIKANGNVDIYGATGTFVDGSEVTYTTTDKEITIIGDVTALNCRENQIDSLNVSFSPKLASLVCSNNNIRAINLSNNASLDTLDCLFNSLTALDVSMNAALRYINVSYNKLKEIDLSRNIDLTELYCDGNRLEVLDVTNNTALKKLYCEINSLSVLDVSRNTALTSLACGSNQLRSLDLSANIALSELLCYENSINESDMSALIASLVDRSLMERKGMLVAIDTKSIYEGNVLTPAHVSAAKARGWNVIDLNSGVPTVIGGISSDGATVTAIYNASGQRIQQLQPGINIVRMSNGMTKKIKK
jgi:Leucine-rich repeat (LRR) protein